MAGTIKSKTRFMVNTKTRLAKLLSVSGQTIKNWSKHPKWKFGKGPYDPELVLAWSNIHLRRPRNPNSKNQSINNRDKGMAEAIRQLDIKRLELLEVTIENQGRKLISRTDHRESMKALVGIFIHEAKNWLQTMPNQLQYKGEVQIEGSCRGGMDAMRSKIASQLAPYEHNGE